MRTHIALAVATVTLASVGWAQSGVPGLNSGLPPKVMIIFDTSNSMRHLPTFDPSSGASIPELPVRGLNYRNDDWDPNNPTAPCDNRFCIGKRTLDSVIPTYANDIQVGLAGYYQYRTRFLLAGGQTQCLYDVVVDAGINQTFRSSTPGLLGTNTVPPHLQAGCTPSSLSLHSYTIASKADIPGAALSCRLYRGDGSGTATSASGQFLEGIGPGASGCASFPTVTFTKGTTTPERSGAMVDTDSPLFIRVARPSACPASGTTFVYRDGANNTSDDQFISTSFTPAPARNGNGDGLFFPNGAGGFTAFTWTNRTGVYAWLTNCLTGMNSNSRACRLSLVGSANAVGNETSNVNVWRNNSGTGPHTAPPNPSTFTAGTVTYTSAGHIATSTITRANVAGVCRWADGSNATANETRILNSLSGFSSLPSGTNCGTTAPHNGCEVTFINQAGGVTTGTWSYSAPSPVYTDPGSATVSATCSVTGATQNLSYNLNTTQTVDISPMAFGSINAACPATQSVTAATHNSRNLTWSSSTFACSGTNPCALDSVNAVTAATDPNTYYRPTNLGDEWRLSSGPTPENINVPRTSYAGTCLSTGTYSDTFAGCSMATPCDITSLGLDSSAGGTTTQDNWFASDIAPYTRDVGGTMVTFTAVPASATTVGSVLSFVKPVGGCSASLTLNGNEDLTGFGVSGACTASRPCRLTFQNEECRDVGGAGPPYPVIACPAIGAPGDDLIQRRCVYGATKYRYDPPFIGMCRYQRNAYRYDRPACRYRARSWVVDTSPACQVAAPGVCNFSLSRYQYSYPDPFNYCRVVGESVEYTGSAPGQFDYTYATKGGEFLGTVSLTPSRPSIAGAVKSKLEERNFCELQPQQYSDFSAACPERINSANAATFAMTSECGSNGRSCVLRWRRSTTIADGGVFANGRVSYAQPQADYEALDFGRAKCLTPDRPSGEAPTPNPTTLLTATDPNGFLSVRQAAANYFGGGWGDYQMSPSTWVQVGGGGTYALYARSFPMQAGGEPIRVSARLVVEGTGAVIAPSSTASVTTSAPTGSDEVIAWNFTIPANTRVRVQFNFDNDYYDAVTGADRNWRIRGTSGSTEIVGNRSVWLEKRPDDFCWGTGSNVEQIRLRSDWYEPAVANPAAAGIPYATNSGNQAYKVSGWSRRGDGDAGELFVEMAAGSSNVGAIRKALSACVRPDSLTQPLDGGFCWADQRTCGTTSNESCQDLAATAGMSDFTPLYGSLTNVYDYMHEQLVNDDSSQYECRDYYVLLITDGLESTPVGDDGGYSDADLISAVDKLRHLDAGTRSKSVQTFVIGFGAGLSGGDGGAGQLDLMARTGGTAMRRNGSDYTFDPVGGFALSAVNAGELSDSLSIVLNNITAGRFSRSRPALTTDGNRLYQTYFDRGATDGGTQRELLGNMVAFRLDVSGAVSGAQWEWRDKVDRQSPGSPNSPNTPATRLFRTWIPYSDGGFSGPQNFDPGNSTVTDYIDSVAGSPSSSGSAVVRFVRNDGLGSHADERFSSGLLRRTSRAGAVAFSGPVVVGRSPFPNSYGGASGEPAAGSYATFKTAFDNRPLRVIIGGWDGLLRGVMDRTSTGADCTVESAPGCKNGAEAWAVVPPAALTRLYDVRHNELGRVDGPTAVADVCWEGTDDARECTASDWRTVMISSLRQGGEELAAFDITDGGTPTLLWRFNDRTDLVDGSDDDLGQTYAPPVVGRVTVNGKKKWVGFMGGGRGGGDEGDGIYVLDMKTGQPRVGTGSNNVTKFTGWDVGDEDVIGRPALYKRAGLADVESAYFGTQNGTIAGMRTWDTNDPNDKWEPAEFYDPWDNDYKRDVFGNDRAPIYYVDKTTGTRLNTDCEMELGHGGSPAAWLSNPSHPAHINNCSDLNTRRPFYNRPRVASVFDTSRNKPDLYIGTGDINNLNVDLDPGNPERNFFFAIHDRKFPLGSSPDFDANKAEESGRTMWVYMFDKNEKVISEPAFVGGSVVVATYVQPQRACRVLGDSYLYAFDPRDGTPRRSLEDPANPGQFVSVVRLQNVGVLSDLVAANGSIYYSTGAGGIRRTVVRQAGDSGKIQGWRRVR